MNWEARKTLLPHVADRLCVRPETGIALRATALLAFAGGNNRMNIVDLVYNCVVLMFWARIWRPYPGLLPENPYIRGVESFTDPLTDILKPIAPSRSFAAALVVVVLLGFRAAAFPSSGPDAGTGEWSVHLGLTIVRPAGNAVWQRCFFSVISFLVLVFHAWALYLVMLLCYGKHLPEGRISEFFQRMCLPFSRVPAVFKPVALLCFGLALMPALRLIGAPEALAGVTAATDVSHLSLRALLSVLAGMVNVLQILQYMLIGFILASWIGMFVASQSIMIACREWIDFILGPLLRRFRLTIGFIDLTPIVALFGLQILHNVLLISLALLYSSV